MKYHKNTSDELDTFRMPETWNRDITLHQQLHAFVCPRWSTTLHPWHSFFSLGCSRAWTRAKRSAPMSTRAHLSQTRRMIPVTCCNKLQKKKTLKKTLRILERMQEKMVHLWNLKAEPELLFFILKTHRCCDFCTRKNNKIVSKHKVCQVTCMPFSRSWTLYGLGLPKKSSGRSSAKEHKGLLKLPWNPVDFCPGIWFKYIWTILSSCHLDSGFIRDKHIE